MMRDPRVAEEEGTHGAAPAAARGLFAVAVIGRRRVRKRDPGGRGGRRRVAATTARRRGAGRRATSRSRTSIAGKFNVAMVLIGPHDDGGWSQAHYEGLQYLCENVAGRHVAYIELVPEGADSEQVFRSLARKGFNFIIGTSFGYMDPMATVAEEFPDKTFLHLTGYKSNGKNFGNFFGAVEDMKYLAGHARRLARQEGRQPEDRLHGHLPDPRGAPPRQRDHARRQGDLPRVHDGRPVHQHLARPGRRSATAPPRCSTPAPTSSSPGPTRRAVADVAKEKGKWARHLRPSRRRARSTPA